MPTATNIKVTANNEELKAAFAESAKYLKDFAGNFNRLADDFTRSSSKLNDSVNQTVNPSKFDAFQRQIKSVFSNLNADVNLATGRQQLFGASVEESGRKVNAYTTALNKLLSLGLSPSSKEAQELIAKIKELNAEIAKSPKAGPSIGNRMASFGAGIAMGDTAGALGGLVGGGAGLAVGVLATKVKELGSEIVNTTDRFEGYKIVLENVLGSSYKADLALSNTIRLAKLTGFDIDSLAKSYKGLAASTKDTVLEGRQTDRIFEAVIKRGASLKLSNEQIERSLLAISQMMSKGTVSAEELRQQLGEAMPGAFNMMAKALGVTTQELGKMLKAGEVLASDALPKLAAEMEKTTGLTYARNLETISGSASALKTNISLLYKAIGDNAGVVSAISKLNNGLSSIVSKLSNVIRKGTLGELLTMSGYALTGGFASAKMVYDGIANKAEARVNRLDAFRGTTADGRSDLIFKQIKDLKTLDDFIKGSEFKKLNEGKQLFYLNALAKGSGVLKQLQDIDSELIKIENRKEPVVLGKEKKVSNSLGNGLAYKEVLKNEKASFKELQDFRDSISKEIEKGSKSIAKALDSSYMTFGEMSQKGYSGIQKIAKMFEQEKIGFKVPDINTPMKKFIADIDDAAEKTAKRAKAFQYVIFNALSGSAQALGAALVTGENPFKAFGSFILQSLGDILVKIGEEMVIASGVLAALSTASLGATAPVSYGQLVGGLGIIAAGGALKSVKLAKGGVAYGPTLATVGDNMGAGYNPEVVAPLDTLTGIIVKALTPKFKTSEVRGNLQPIFEVSNVFDGDKIRTNIRRRDRFEYATR